MTPGRTGVPGRISTTACRPASRSPSPIAADSAAVEVEIDRVEPVLDSIEVVAGTDLWDPARPIALSSAGDAAICFTGMAAGRQIAGLDVQP